MKKLYLLLLLFPYLFCNAQIYDSDLDIYKYSTVNKLNSDTIDFIKIGKDLDNKKPTLIFCQGSLPIPLVIEFDNGQKMIPSINNFDYKKVSEKFNIILISKPFIPIEVNHKRLNSSYCVITDNAVDYSFPENYLNSNFIDNYVERGNLVIDFLIQQKWVDVNNIFIVGHSEGAKIATLIAYQNSHIKALGFFSGNPIGRIDQYVRTYRRQELLHQISHEIAQEKINEVYLWWKDSLINDDVESKSIVEFSIPLLDKLLNLDIPIFVAYGTVDIAASYCDLLPIDFIRAGKTNLEHRPYAGLEHNFFKVDDNFNPIYEDDPAWPDVMDHFLSWYIDSTEKFKE